MLYVAYENQSFSSQIEYVFGVIFSVYGIKWQGVSYTELPKLTAGATNLLISYGKQKPSSPLKPHIHIYESDLFGQNYLQPESSPKFPLSRHEGLPIIYAGQGHLNGWVSQSDNLIETNIDIMASAFFMLSRYEEVIQEIRDDYERFPARASLAYQENFLDRPIVNEYLELLWSWIHSLMPHLRRKTLWPDDKEFAVGLTYDIDSLRRYSVIPPIFSTVRALLKHGQRHLAFQIARDYLGTFFRLKKDPMDTFDYLLSGQQKYGFKSSFYFMSGGETEFDAKYSIDESKVRRLIQKIEHYGCEVGLHPSYNTYNDFEKLAHEKERLDKAVRHKSYGCRQHCLRWKTPDTWRLQEKAGLLYDTTLTFADHAGFRCGFSLPFRPFDILANRQLAIWELPLTVMEGSLENPGYQNLSPEEAYHEIIKLLDVTEKFNGVFVLLWHNSSFYPPAGWTGWREVYEKVMADIGQRHAFVSSGREIVERWQQVTEVT